MATKVPKAIISDNASYKLIKPVPLTVRAFFIFTRHFNNVYYEHYFRYKHYLYYVHCVHYFHYKHNLHNAKPSNTV